MALPLDIIANCKRCNSIHVVRKESESYIINSCFHCYTELEIDIKNKILAKLCELVGKDLVSDIILTSDVRSIKISNVNHHNYDNFAHISNVNHHNYDNFAHVEIGDIYNKDDIIAIGFSFRNYIMIYIIEENSILYKRYRNDYYGRLTRGENIIMSW